MGVKCSDYDYSKYDGCVLWHREENGYHDSDWYATVWDEESQSVKEVLFQTTRAGMNGSAEIDCTIENKIKAAKWQANRLFTSCIREIAVSVTIGRTVEVVKGRKVPKGIVGKVVKMKENAYQSWNEQVLIETDDEDEYWTYEDNLKVLPYTEEEKVLIYQNCLKSVCRDQMLRLEYAKVVA